MLAAIGTLAFGAVLGPEMPLIALGSVAGVEGRQREVLGRIDLRAPRRAASGRYADLGVAVNTVKTHLRGTSSSSASRDPLGRARPAV